jgi:serine/threonine protein kinase/Tfp pilus assembly protein PilF
MIGRTISHYRIVEKLGEGGMGVVYVAEDTLLGRRVAIKTLTAARSTQGDQFRSRFLREARAISALSHPHIATIHDYGETDDGQPYIVMELVKGETLNDLMHRGVLTLSRATEIIEQVAEALAEAHRHGIIHRDVKPSNVAISERGEVKVLDFGLAKQINLSAVSGTDPEGQTLLNAQTQEGIIIGTPMYLSPEQALGADVDARGDLFSLGAVLYECIAGRPAFQGASRVEICASVIREDPPPPSRFNSDIPEQLDRIVLKALAKKPEARYQTADDMIAGLQDARAGLQALDSDRAITRIGPSVAGTRPTGALATLSDIFRRPRLSLGYVVLGVVALAALAFGLWYVTRGRPHQPPPEAQRLYILAVDSLREGAFFKSSKILQQSIQDDDRFALAHARLAEAWTELDFSDKAKDELIRAGDLVPDRSVLPKVDALRLQAIIDTVKRDFGKAVEDYRALASSVPEAERAYALVDLGRAYEKNEQPDKAVESFQEASKRAPRYAAAFLRLGVILGRRQRFPDAEAAFDQAHKLFDVSNEIEGIAEVLYQRGLLFSQQGRVAAAQGEFQRALERSVALENKDQQIKILQQLSNTFIVAGDAARAQQYSQEAIQLAQANGMENLTTAGLIGIGNAYFITGNFPEAEKNFNEALRLAQLFKGRRNEARALLSLASLRKQQDDPDATRDFVQRALPFYQQGGYRKETSQAYTILGHAYDEVGDYESAQRAFEQELQVAQQVGDPQSVALAHEGLGFVFLNAQRFSDALSNFDEDYKIVKSLNIKLVLGYGANYRGTVLWQLGRYEDARTALAEALSIAQPTGHEPYKELLAEATLSEARLALSEGKFPEAITKAQRSIDLAGSEYKLIAVRARYTSSLGQALSGQVAASRKRCDEAVRLARSMRNPLALSEALLALAEVALLSGDVQTALATAAEAQQRFAAAKQHESEWRALLIEARASNKSGDSTRARHFASQANTVLAALEQEWGSDNYKTYLTRPDVVERQGKLTSLLAET